MVALWSARRRREATIVALNKETGDGIWKTALPEADQAAYASAIVVNAAGVKQYVQFLQKGLVGVDANTGKLLWRYTKTAEGSPANIPTPIAQGDLVYSSAGRSGGGLVKIKNDGGEVIAEQVYFEQKLPTSIGGAVDSKGTCTVRPGKGWCAPSSPPARANGRSAATGRARFVTPTGAFTSTTKKMTSWRWSILRPTPTRKKGDLLCPTNRITAEPRPGPIPWWQTGVCTCEI